MASAAGKASHAWEGGEGPGWVLGCDADAAPDAFGGLVGAAGWSVAVTRGEYDDFVQARARAPALFRNRVGSHLRVPREQTRSALLAPRCPGSAAASVRHGVPGVRLLGHAPRSLS